MVLSISNNLLIKTEKYYCSAKSMKLRLKPLRMPFKRLKKLWSLERLMRLIYSRK
jgi:hypothetical protein